MTSTGQEAISTNCCQWVLLNVSLIKIFRNLLNLVVKVNIDIVTNTIAYCNLIPGRGRVGKRLIRLISLSSYLFVLPPVNQLKAIFICAYKYINFTVFYRLRSFQSTVPLHYLFYFQSV